ncbi:MAG: hypothetical protein VYC95_01225, partial [Verrucomicrobiota bacterium]|nr:hypothetical protein [Verrucomicrobiota bacterium]
VREEISRRTRLWYEAAYNENSETWEICSRYLRRMAEVTRREKIPLVVLLLPPILKTDGDYPYGWIHDQVIARLDELGIQSIDLRDVFDGQEAETLWVHPTDHHPNELAHRLIAAHIGPLVTPLIQKSR